MNEKPDFWSSSRKNESESSKNFNVQKKLKTEATSDKLSLIINCNVKIFVLINSLFFKAVWQAKEGKKMEISVFWPKDASRWMHVIIWLQIISEDERIFLIVKLRDANLHASNAVLTVIFEHPNYFLSNFNETIFSDMCNEAFTKKVAKFDELDNSDTSFVNFWNVTETVADPEWVLFIIYICNKILYTRNIN